MAKVSYTSPPAELEALYHQILKPGDRFEYSRIVLNRVISSRKKIAGLTSKSYLPIISDLWQGFSEAEKAIWKDIDFHPRQHGWRTFVADQSKRIKFGIAGVATPSEFHQDLVGQILIEAPASEVKISQPHPFAYYIYKKVSGTKSQYQPTLVTERFSLPFQIGISYKSDLVSVAAGSFAKFFATVIHLYQGRYIETEFSIDIPLSSAWDRATATLSSILGRVVFYDLTIHLYDVQGTLLFDNVSATHNSQNWARDPYCVNIKQSFTRAFYQVPKNWAPDVLPAGAGYDSAYPE